MIIMLIKMISTIAGPDVSASAGQTISVDKSFGDKLIAEGYAVPVADTAIETAVLRTPETAVAVTKKPNNKRK